MAVPPIRGSWSPVTPGLCDSGFDQSDSGCWVSVVLGGFHPILQFLIMMKYILLHLLQNRMPLHL